MSQEFLLNIPTAPAVAKPDVAKSADQPSKVDNTDKRSFSSALDEQVEQRDTHKNKQAEKAEIPKEKSTDKLSQKEIDDKESGNVLPEDDSTDSELIASTQQPAELIEELDTEIDVSIITELKSELTKPTETKVVVSAEQLTTAKVIAAESGKAKTDSQLRSETKTGSVSPVFNVMGGADENNDVDGVDLNKKQPTTNLRSDIFHALSKNKSAEMAVLDNSATKNHKALLGQLTDRAERSDRSHASFSTALASTSFSAASVQNSLAAQPALAVQPAIHSEAWSRVMSSRVVWMAREGIQEASLRLNPANLGPVEVKLNMHSDQANVLFIAQNAATRDALEQALPRLRESFEENGMQLADAEVADQEFEQADDNESANGESVHHDAEQKAQLEEENGQVAHTEQDLEVGLSIYA